MSTTSEPVTIVDKRGKGKRKARHLSAVPAPAPLIDTLAATPEAADQLAANVRNLAGSLWWKVQGAGQRDDPITARRYAEARGRVLSEAAKAGVPLT